MPIIFLIIFILMIKGDRNNWFTSKQFKKFKKAAIGLFIASVLISAMPQLLLLTSVIAFLGSPIIVPIAIYKLAKAAKNKNSSEVNIQSDDATGKYYAQNATTAVKSNILPKAASKRRKIIEKFNKKFDLTLTESQIQRMVDASYYSPEWQREIEDMTKEYASVYEWFQGNTSWLRAYIKAFNVQSISSDFQQQKEICFSEFDQVFAGVNLKNALSQEDAIREINNRYFTGFDDISFMIAYRFLEANGRKYDLYSSTVVRNEDETEILARKYDQMPMR